MKTYSKIALVLLVLVILFSCSKDTTEFDRLIIPTSLAGDAIPKSVFMGVAATWCPACGDYGAKILLDMEESATKEDLLIMDIHVNDVLACKEGTAMDDNWESLGMPRFMINGALIDGYPTRYALQQVDSFKNTAPPVGLVLEHQIVGDTILVKAKTQFFKDTNGQFSFNCYVIDHGSVHPQKGSDGTTFPDMKFEEDYYADFVHNHILRASGDGSAFGAVYSSGKAKDGDTHTFEFKIPVQEDWMSDLEVRGVVWETDGRTSRFVNAY